MVAVALVLATCGLSGPRASLLERIVAAESQGRVLAINVNGAYELVRQPSGAAEAQEMARWLLEHGHSFDAGLAQVNSANFARLGLSVETVFDPCTNLKAGLRVLEECRARAEQKYAAGDRAVAAAVSCYNTGDLERGIRNGYVASVQREAFGGRGSPSQQSSAAGRAEESRVEGPGDALGALGARTLDVFGQGAAR